MVRKRQTKTILFSGVLAGISVLSTAALAQRYAPVEQDGKGRTCSQTAQMCLQRAGQQICESAKQECMRSGTWNTQQGVIRNLERR